jgi:hypothetical protein
MVLPHPVTVQIVSSSSAMLFSLMDIIFLLSVGNGLLICSEENNSNIHTAAASNSTRKEKINYEYNKRDSTI